jgi:drug/metabolite transporter (DMT)-like permease
VPQRTSFLSWPLIITVLSWGFNFVALKLLYREMSPAAVGLVRFVLMYACVLAVCWVLKEPLKFPAGKRTPILIQGALSMGIYIVLFLEGMARTGAAEGAIILASAPIFTGLIAVAAKQEPFRMGVLLGGLLALCGVATVVLGGAAATNAVELQSKILGDVLILISALVWAGQAVLSKPIVSRVSPRQLLALGMPAALVILLPYGFTATMAVQWSSLSVHTWMYIAHVTLLAGAVGFAGFFAGVRKIGASSAMLYQFFVPPLAALTEWLFLGKALHPIQFVGLALVLAGVTVASRSRHIPLPALAEKTS